MLGWAIGVGGMGLDDFVRLTPSEFSAVVEHVNRREDTRSRDGWEQARVVAKMAVQPYMKKDVRLEEFMPLPWDGKAERAPEVSREEDKKRLEGLLERMRSQKL